MDKDNPLKQAIEKLVFAKIFKTFSMAISHNKLLIALFAIVILWLSGSLMDQTKTVSCQFTTDSVLFTELDQYINNSREVKHFLLIAAETGEKTGVFSTVINFISNKFNHIIVAIFDREISNFFKSISEIGLCFVWAFVYHPIYSVVYMLVCLCVFSVAGGAICRIAALEISRGEKLGAIEAIRFSIDRFLSLFGAPLLPACIVVLLGLAVLFLGVVGNIPYIGEISVGLAMLPALILGTLMSLVIIGALAGSSLMYPVIAFEGTDSFDVMSRTFSYVYTKPWHLALCYILSIVYGGICYIIVRFFTFLILSMTYFFLWISLLSPSANQTEVSKLDVIWQAPKFFDFMPPAESYSLIFSESVSRFFVNISVSIVIALMVSFMLSFIFSANTVIYAVMRNKVDNVPLTDIFMEQQTDNIPAAGSNQ